MPDPNVIDHTPPVRLFGYEARLTIDVDGVRVDVTPALVLRGQDVVIDVGRALDAIDQVRLTAPRFNPAMTTDAQE